MNFKTLITRNTFAILCLIAVIGLLFYTRFINLGWGLPYPFHPDERNMAVAIQGLNCSNIRILSDCFNPHFFAYGQLPLYLGYLLIQIWHLLSFKIGSDVTFEEATLSLRFISAAASVLTVLIMYKLLSASILSERAKPQLKNSHLMPLLIFIFSPGLIQFAHFGTTESLLMLAYTTVIYWCLLLLNNQVSRHRFMIITGIIAGLAIAVKLSSAVFMAVPVIAYCLSIVSNSVFKAKQYVKKMIPLLSGMSLFVVVAIIAAVIGSPHNLISWHDFVGSIHYESDVATGAYVAFYTQQFVQTVPILFQLTHIFPFALGLPVTIFFLLGFMLLPWNKQYNLLRFAFLIYFLPNAFLFAKWTRFMAPIMPEMIIIAVMFLVLYYRMLVENLPKIKWLTQLVFSILTILVILPGVLYLKVYMQEDVRFSASQWIFDHLPANSTILSETANVVDIPLITPDTFSPKPYNVISFDFYNVDANVNLQQQLVQALQTADYILVPSRRLFANYTCTKILNSHFPYLNVTQRQKCQTLQTKFPQLNSYYEQLFSGKLGFRQVAEFKVLPDEEAEETWTVFDHPVIRIYKRI